MSKLNKEESEQNLIESWKPIFNLYPDLNIIPVYSWGRYYKYESAGNKFEYDGKSIEGLSETCNNYTSLFDEKHLKIFQEIDAKENSVGGEVYMGKNRWLLSCERRLC